MSKKQSGKFSLLIAVIADLMQNIFNPIARSIHKTKTEENINLKGMPGNVYEMGCNAVSGEIIVGGLDRGSSYSSDNPES